MVALMVWVVVEPDDGTFIGVRDWVLIRLAKMPEVTLPVPALMEYSSETISALADVRGQE